MKVDRLCLKNYRNIDLVDIEFSPYVNILTEITHRVRLTYWSLFFCVLPVEARRTRNDKELIQFDNQSAYQLLCE